MLLNSLISILYRANINSALNNSATIQYDFQRGVLPYQKLMIKLLITLKNNSASTDYQD